MITYTTFQFDCLLGSIRSSYNKVLFLLEYKKYIFLGSGRNQMRNLYIADDLKFDLEFDAAEKVIKVKTSSKATRVFYENHLQNGENDFSLVFKTHPEMRKHIHGPKRRRRAVDELLGVITLTQNELQLLESYSGKLL